MSARIRTNPERRGRLVSAAYKGNLDEIKALVAEGEDINARNDRGSRAINVAAEENKTDVVSWLVQNGAAVNSIDTSNFTPLTRAILNQNTDMAILLLDHGANVDLFGKSEHPAAWIMSKQGDDLLLNKILDKVTDIDVCDQVGKTLLFSAIDSGRVEWVRNLIARGASLDQRNSTGGYALHVAARVSPAMIECLLPYCENLEIRNFSGLTPLHVSDKPECVRALVAAGADINARNKDGSTPLVAAIHSGHLAKMPSFAEAARPVIMELLALGADLNAANHKEETARSLVKHYKIQYLRSVVAAIDARTRMAGIVDQAKARTQAQPV